MNLNVKSFWNIIENKDRYLHFFLLSSITIILSLPCFELCIVQIVVNYEGSSLTSDTDLVLMFVVLMIPALPLLIRECNQVLDLYLSCSSQKLSIVKVPTAMVNHWKEVFLYPWILALVETTNIQVVLLYPSKFFLLTWMLIWKGNFFLTFIFFLIKYFSFSSLL